jgi:protein-S-isoprenylcysteine O-methyltransferase Ste14
VSQPRKFWMRWRVRVGYPVAVIFWLLARPTPRFILIGGIIAAAGLLIRGAAAGYLRKDRELTITGPYAYTRNPLYLGSSLLAAGFAVAGHSWIAAVVVMAYFTVFYYAVMRNEEKGLRERFGQVYENYDARVPLFFPRLTAAVNDTSERGTPPPEKFSWPEYGRNREYQALIGTIAGLGFMWLRMWLSLQGFFRF